MRINDVVGQTISVISDWRGIVINPQTYRFGRLVAWANEPHMLDYPVLGSDVLDLIADRQYTFQIIEDRSVTGIIQLSYLYDRREAEIESASLAFYSTKPIIRGGSEHEIQQYDIEITESEEFQIIDMGNVTERPVSWLRIDYAPGDTTDIIHHGCHMHICGFPEARFVVCGLPNPKQFTEFILASFYPGIYRHHRLDPQQNYRVLTNIGPLKSVNSQTIDLPDYPAYQQIAHFRIPFRQGS